MVVKNANKSVALLTLKYKLEDIYENAIKKSIKSLKIV